MLKRICVYVVYDADGIVDDYIPFWLNALREHISHLVIVCNGKLNKEGRTKLAHLTSDIFVRENTGFDGGAVKDTLDKFIGWERVLEYDELLICNDTFYGPIYPLEEMFSKMNAESIDFWGITADGDYYVDSLASKLDYHLQSFFLNVKKTLLHSTAFREYWNSMPPLYTKADAVLKYEVRFSAFFSERGYCYLSYISSDDYHSSKEEYNCYYFANDPMRTIKHDRCPIIKKQSFRVSNNESVSYYGNERKNEMMEDLLKLGYPIDLIYNNVLRTLDTTQIYSALHLKYILPENTSDIEKHYKNILVSASLNDENSIAEALEYLLPLKETCDIYVITLNHKVEKLIAASGLKVIYLSKGDEDVSQPLIPIKDIAKDYDYLCFIHDRKDSVNDRAVAFAASSEYLLWENMIATRYYVDNIVHLFESNHRLGVLYPPSPYHGEHFCDFSPFVFGDTFWCRVEALDNLLSDQAKKSFLRGVVQSRRYSEVRLTDMEDLLSALIRKLQSKYEFHSIKECLTIIEDSDPAMIDFAKEHNPVYIYGAGQYGRHAMNILSKKNLLFEGFIITDGQLNPMTFEHYPVWYLSETDLTPGTGVIIAIDKNHRTEIIKSLKAKYPEIDYFNMQ